MRKAALLYNPVSGGSKRRLRELQSALAIFRAAGVEAELVSTETPAHAQEETRRAIAAGAETIFACGGDGTVHNLIQVLANTEVALGILPIGTANALAHDLDIPRRIVAAARVSLKSDRRRIALGRVTYTDRQGNSCSRFFVLAAGIGVDAHLFYKLRSGVKQRMGMAAYYYKAWHMWFTYPMTRFTAEYEENGATAQPVEVTELMAIRIRNFGGVVQELAPGASLDRDDMRLVFSRTASRWKYLVWVTRGLLRMSWNVEGIDLAYSKRVSCRYSPVPQPDSRRIYVEADGELLGTLPVEITVVPNALTILAPK